MQVTELYFAHLIVTSQMNPSRDVLINLAQEFNKPACLAGMVATKMSGRTLEDSSNGVSDMPSYG